MGKMRKHFENVVRPTWNFSGRLKTQRDNEMNAIVGLAAEAGEVLDVGKKDWFHTEKDRRQEYLLELGDVAYYFLVTLDILGFTLEEVLAANKEKLQARHPQLGKVKEVYDAK